MRATTIDDVQAKIATIVPIKHLGAISGYSRHMALSHLVEHGDYRTFYSNQADMGKWITLDNSAVELGEPEDFATYLEKAQAIGATEIMLPDHFQNVQRTYNEAKRCIHILQQKKFEPGYGLPAVMVIPQGNTQVEWLQCLMMMLDMPLITSIGISRRYISMFGQSRLFACYITRWACLQKNRPSVRVHLLGSGPIPEHEVAPCLWLPWVQGVDSAMPSYYTKLGHTLGANAGRLPVELDFENDLYDPGLMDRNVRMWRGLCSQFHPHRLAGAHVG